MAKRENKRKRSWLDEWLRRCHLLYGLEGKLHAKTEESRSMGPSYVNEHLVLCDSFAKQRNEHTDDDLAELLAGEEIADLIRVWDCDHQRWCDDTPVIVRMIGDDLTLWRDAEGFIRCWLGPIKTELSIDAFGASEAGSLGTDEPALQWRSDWRFGSFFGDLIRDVHVMNEIDHSQRVFALLVDSEWFLEFYTRPDFPALGIGCHALGHAR